MSKLLRSINNETKYTRTFNNAKTFTSSQESLVDLFSIISSSRGKDISSVFIKAFKSDKDLTCRIILWCRDIRGGAGERQTFRDLLKVLIKCDIEYAKKVISKIPELGRWDDMFFVYGINNLIDEYILNLIVYNLKNIH